MENLTIDNNAHRPNAVENYNESKKSISSNPNPSTISSPRIRVQGLEMDQDMKTVTSNPSIKVRGIDVSNDGPGNEEFSKVIVNIIDDDGNYDAKNPSDGDGIWMEAKDGAFSSRSPESRSPRSKSNSLNSDQLISHLR